MRTTFSRLEFWIGPVTASALLLLCSSTARAQGSLTPPGPPAATMRTLLQIEPRTPISSLPFTISSPGSYFLTTNLTGTSGQNGITVAANNVVLDLRGFTLAGVAGSSNGILVSSAGSFSNLNVRGGVITGWGAAGLDADSMNGGRFSELTVSYNGGDGLEPGTSAEIIHCAATHNSSDGFGSQLGTDSKCKFQQCNAIGNTGGGFSTWERCMFQGCLASDNGLDGFNPFYDATLTDCTSAGNGFDGVDDPYAGCVITQCTCGYNGGHGINVGDVCTVRGSSAGNNGGNGILTVDNSLIDSCTTASNELDNVYTGAGCTVSHTSAGYSTTGNGFTLGSGNIITGSSAYANAYNGIDAGDRSMVQSCTASFNNNAGIHVAYQGTIEQCTSGNNGFCGILSDANGYALILQNNCTFNGLTSPGGTPTQGAGIIITNSPGCRVEANVTDLNYEGVVVASGNHALVIRNSAQGSVSTNFAFGTGNSWGPIVNVSAGGDISTVTNSGQPEANFIH